MGFIDKEGKIIQGWHQKILVLNNGIYKVLNKNKWTIINNNLQQICDYYIDIQSFNDNFIAVQRDDKKWALINCEGKQICNWYDQINIFYNGFAQVQNNNNKSFINTHGKQICDWYRNVRFFCEGYAAVQGYDGKWSFINMDGKRICGWYNNVENFKIGFALVSLNGKWYYIDTKGNLYDDRTRQLISVQNESYTELNNLIDEALYTSLRNYLLYN